MVVSFDVVYIHIYVCVCVCVLTYAATSIGEFKISCTVQHMLLCVSVCVYPYLPLVSVHLDLLAHLVLLISHCDDL